MKQPMSEKTTFKSQFQGELNICSKLNQEYNKNKSGIGMQGSQNT